LHITDLLAETEQVGANGQPVEVVRNCTAAVPGVRRGHGVVYQVIGSGKHHAIQPYFLSFDPGGGYGEDKISHVGEEFAYVLHGEVELLLGPKAHPLAQGDIVRFRTETPHAFRNASAVGMAVVIGAATPPW
jgi:glyoxylate utilization-related uncharacterized protein